MIMGSQYSGCVTSLTVMMMPPWIKGLFVHLDHKTKHLAIRLGLPKITIESQGVADDIHCA